MQGRRYPKNEEDEMAILELLQMKEPDLYRKGIFNTCQDGANKSI
jgi:hypothetical protein